MAQRITTDPIHAVVDRKALNTFLHDYYNMPLPGGATSSILTTAFHALLSAGVVELDDGTDYADPKVDINNGRVRLIRTDPATGDEIDTWWVPEKDLPSFDPAIDALVDLLVKILGSEPYDGPLDWPHVRW
jgi:hypothetical protein